MIKEMPMPTHKVSFYGIRCWFNMDTGDLWGLNWFWELLIEPACFIHNIICDTLHFIFPSWRRPGFPLKILEVYDDFGNRISP